MMTGLAAVYARLMVAVLAGALAGAALGHVDLLFLARLIDFKRPRNFGPTGEFVSELLVAIAVSYGALVGGVTAFLLPCRGPLLARALPGAVLGGYLGAGLGFIVVAVIGQYLNLMDSDLVATWRENRSLLVVLNATCAAGVGALVSCISMPIRKSPSPGPPSAISG